MTDSDSASTPLEIDRVQSSRSGAGQLRLRLSGRWLDPQAQAEDEEELLVVQVEGRRHRFPSSPDYERDAELEPGRWSASFTVPVWAEPRHDGQAALWLGDAVIAVPPLHGSHGATPASRPSEGNSQPLPEPESKWSGASAEVESVSTPRAGPLADLLLKETVAALHAELEERTADAAHMRGALADAQSELQARLTTQTQLEATLGELRGELRRLVEAVEEQRRELEQSRSEIERARPETDRQIAELAATQDRHAAELTATKDRHAAEVEALHEQVSVSRAGADRSAAEAIALREQLAAATVSREAAVSEVAGLRAELGRLGAELAVTRERVSSESGDLGEASRLLADARALADELRTPRPAG